ncbi:PREDICTED: transmembrane channel-like protein 7 [Priapulus caudatus]|uniref:Transmembrane channel-like protein 7 n=1 Tax=Priapulus caudatus TaxID=37621 RepID=A0ABM1DXA9_PRICU|nr:PREDICTED: transmembrane channel-like protein 7 [Priapulus caudatus]
MHESSPPGYMDDPASERYGSHQRAPPAPRAAYYASPSHDTQQPSTSSYHVNQAYSAHEAEEAVRDDADDGRRRGGGKALSHQNSRTATLGMGMTLSRSQRAYAMNRMGEQLLSVSAPDEENLPTRRRCWAKNCFSTDHHSHPMTSKRFKDMLAGKGYEIVEEKGAKGFWFKTKRKWNNFLDNFKVWDKSMKEVEGNFGSGVMSYFAFVRWLLVLNFLILLLMVIFVTLPSVFFDKAVNSDAAAPPDDGGDIIEPVVCNMTVQCCAAQYLDALHSRSSLWYDYVLDIFQGTGWMEYTWFFIGYYNNSDLDIQGVSFDYSVPLAYIVVTGIYVLCSAILMLSRFSEHWKERLVAQESMSVNRNMQYVFKVFTGWDFTLSSAKTADLNHLNIYQLLIADLAEERRQERVQSRTFKEKCKLILLRQLINLVVILVLVGVGAIILLATVYTQEVLSSSTSLSTVESLALEFLPPLTITVLYMFVSVGFTAITKLGQHELDTEINVILLRIVFLRLTSLAMLVYAVIRQVTQCESSELGSCGECNNLQCWETYFGQQIYKLAIVDLGVLLIVTFLVEFPRKILDEIRTTVPPFTMPLAGASMWLFNRDKLPATFAVCSFFRLGPAFFCLRWLGAAMVIAFIRAFYVKKLSLMVNYQPSRRLGKVSRSNAFFLVVLLIAFFLCLVPIGWSMFKITPSLGCGPFRGSGAMYDVVIAHIGDLPDFPRDVFWFVASTIALTSLVVLLILTTHFYRTKSSAYQIIIEKMRDDITTMKSDRAMVTEIVQVGVTYTP